MNFFIKLICAVLVLGLGGLFYLKGPNGEAILSKDDFVPDVSELKQEGAALLSKASALGEGSKENTQVYRHRAADGTWVFSDSPDPMGKAELIELKPNLRDEDPVKHVQKAEGEAPSGVKLPGFAGDLMEQARGVQGIVDQQAEKTRQGTNF